MADYIDRQELLAYHKANSKQYVEKGYVTKMIKNAHSADVVPVVHGRWKEENANGQYGSTNVGALWTHYHVYRCSNCNKTNGNRQTDFCPYCGAKMDEVSE